MRKAYYAVLVVALGWCAAIFITPLLCEKVASFFYLFFHLSCHQLPERSFFIFGKALPVCSRCTGLYLGALFGVLIYPIKKFVASKKLLLIASTPIGLDGLGQLVGLWASTNLLRFTTGAFFGMVVVLFILPDLMEVLSFFYAKLSKR